VFSDRIDLPLPLLIVLKLHLSESWRQLGTPPYKQQVPTVCKAVSIRDFTYASALLGAVAVSSRLTKWGLWLPESC
jgi:hypothetical protein